MEQLAADSFGAYSRLWVVSEVVGLVMEPFCVPDQRWLLALGPALVVAFVEPTRGSLGLTLALRIAMSAHQAPYHFDSAIWKMQTDLAVLLAVALHEREHAMTACGWVVQGQMSLFYLASGFWKINTAFLDHRVSCAPILFLALLEYLPPTLTPLALTRFLTVIAPWTTIIGEMAIGVLVLGNLTMQCLGVALAVVLHFMIAITPFPNLLPSKLLDPKLTRTTQKLEKSLGDETWRAKGTGVTFFYESKPGWSQCHRVIAPKNDRTENSQEQGTEAFRKEPCTAGEMAMQQLPPPKGLLGKMLINFGYAIIPELEQIGELPCYD